MDVEDRNEVVVPTFLQASLHKKYFISYSKIYNASKVEHGIR